MPERGRNGCRALAGDGDGTSPSAPLSCNVVAELDVVEQNAAVAAVLLPDGMALVALEPVGRRMPAFDASNAWIFGAEGARRVQLPEGTGGLVTAVSDVIDGAVSLAVEGAKQGMNTLDIVRHDLGPGPASAFARLTDAEPEPVYAPDGRLLGDQMQPSSKVMRSAVHIPHVRLLMTPDGGVVASIAADQSLKVLRYDEDGRPIGKRVLLPVVRGQLRPVLDAALITRSGDRIYAAFPVAQEDEQVALAFYGLDASRARGRGGYLVIEMSASADVLSALFLASPREAVLAPTVIDTLGDEVYVGGSYERGPSDAQPFVAKLVRAAPHGTLALAWSSVLTEVHATASASSLEALGDGGLIIGGLEGAQQAASGSVLTSSPAFVALYEDMAGMKGKLSWGRQGRSYVVAVSAQSACDLRVVSTEGNLLTHEDPGARKAVTVLSSVRIGGCPK